MPINTNQTSKIRIGKRWDDDRRIIDHLVGLHMKADIALRIAGNLAQVTADNAGETSTGEPLYKLLPPEQVAIRSADIADKLVEELNSRGWLYEIPEPPQAVPTEEKK